MNMRRPYQRRGSRGQALVEFAIILPLLLLIFSGVVDFGRVYYQSLLVNEAAREGGRLAALGKSATEVQQAVKSYDNALTVAVLPSVPVKGENVAVTVRGAVSIITPLLDKIFPSNPYPLKATVILKVE